MSDIKVSIIVPCYNVEETLERCMNTLLPQHFQPGCGELEFICINDGSTDDTLSLLRAYEARDKRVCVLDKKNGGYGQGVNRGIEMARGEYIGIVEPDDYIEGNMFPEMYKNAAKFNHSCDVVKSNYFENRTDNSVLRNYNFDLVPVMRPFKLKDCAEFTYHHPSIWSCIYKKSFLDGISFDGSVHEPIRLQEIPGAGWSDNLFFLKTLVQASAILYTGKTYYHYYVDSPGSSSTNLGQIKLPFDRWNEMTDYLEQRETSDNIWDGHMKRLMEYARISSEFCDFDNEEVALEYTRQVYNAFSRLDKDRVVNSPRLNMREKKFWLDVMGLESGNIPEAEHFWWIARQRMRYMRGLVSGRTRKYYIDDAKDENAAGDAAQSDASTKSAAAIFGLDFSATTACTDKLLTVVIPTYNIGDYLKRCVDSMACTYAQDLDVLIVDDGSNDDYTAKLADELCKKYPGIVRCIHKENAHYGSVLNCGVAKAQGRYIKICDADDYFDSEGLKTLLAFLRTSPEHNMVLTDYNLLLADGSLQHKRVEDLIPMQSARFDAVEINPLEMYSITYNTRILRESGAHFDEGVLFTDAEFVLYPMPYIKTLIYVPVAIYNYQLGRDGQSVDIEATDNILGDHFKVFNSMLNWYDKFDFSTSSEPHRTYAAKRIGLMASDHIRNYALSKHPKKHYDDVKKIDKLLQSHPDINEHSHARIQDLLKKTHYAALPLASALFRRKRRRELHA